MNLAHLMVDAALLAADIPNPDVYEHTELVRPRDIILGTLKWGGFAIAAGSAVWTGIQLFRSDTGPRGATAAADALGSIPLKAAGVLLVSGLGAGLLGTLL